MKNPTAPLETSMANFHECEWKERALKAEAQLDKVREFIQQNDDWKMTTKDVVKNIKQHSTEKGSEQ